MKLHATENELLARTIREGLKKNNGYCPCVVDSKGKEEYKCICLEMREKIPVGQSCHCGLYVKDEM